MCREIGFKTLDRRGNQYTANSTVRFRNSFYINKYNVERCFKFAFDMASGDKHNPTRSGGIIKRTPNQVFANTFIGKLGECALETFLYFRKINTAELDFEVRERNEWDVFDLEAYSIENTEYKINVKTTKNKGNLLLLETKDWDETGGYIHNYPNGYYNFHVLCRVRLDLPGVMRDKKIFYNKKISDESLLKSLIEENINSNNTIDFDIPGFIIHHDLYKAINNDMILPQGSKLGSSKTKMDAENYYVQSGDMRSIDQMVSYLINN